MVMRRWCELDWDAVDADADAEVLMSLLGPADE